MVFWGDYTGQPMPYRGWNAVVGSEQNGTKTRLTATFNRLLEWLRDYMSVDTVTLLLPVADLQSLAVQATIGLEEEITQQIRIPIGRGIAGHIAASVEPMMVNNLSTVEVVSPILHQKGLRSLVGVPLPVEEGVIGVLHVGNFKSHNFTERDVQQLQLIAHRLGLIIADARL
ncbi:MAG: GAF domain-containing protein [Nostoc sp.]